MFINFLMVMKIKIIEHKEKISRYLHNPRNRKHIRRLKGKQAQRRSRLWKVQ